MTNPLAPITPDYNERAVAHRRESSLATIQQINREYSQFIDATAAIKDNTIASANKAREIGIQLQSLCQHELMDKEFWKNHCAGKTSFDFDTAKIFISIARKMPTPATTLEEAAPCIQTMLIAADQLQLAARTTAQSPSAIPPVQKFVNTIQLLRGPFNKITQKTPMEQWDQTSINLFLSETEWVAHERARAEKLRRT